MNRRRQSVLLDNGAHLGGVGTTQHLVIVCHPKRGSFTETIAQTYATELRALGHEVAVRDLYRVGFDPVLGEGELETVGKPVVPAAIRREQDRLAAAGGVAFFYPLWWGFMPAMMKGYIDRVFSSGFAYDIEGEALVSRLTGKFAVIFTASGADMAYLRRSRQWRSMRLLENQMLSLYGIALLEHVHFPSITADLPKRKMEKNLAVVRDAVQRHWSAAPVPQG
jgi:NAD(P)H dehydrogenase (quinone)